MMEHTVEAKRLSCATNRLRHFGGGISWYARTVFCIFFSAEKVLLQNPNQRYLQTPHTPWQRFPVATRGSSPSAAEMWEGLRRGYRAKNRGFPQSPVPV